jgi:hypothetical protein
MEVYECYSLTNNYHVMEQVPKRKRQRTTGVPKRTRQRTTEVPKLTRQRTTKEVLEGIKTFLLSLGEPRETVVCRLHNHSTFKYENFVDVKKIGMAFRSHLEGQKKTLMGLTTCWRYVTRKLKFYTSCTSCKKKGRPRRYLYTSLHASYDLDVLMVSLHIDACSLANDDLIFSDEAGAGHVNDDLITYDEAGVEQALIRLSRSCLDETVLDDDDAAGQALIRLSRSCLDETVLDDDDARCVFFVFFIITEHNTVDS